VTAWALVLAVVCVRALGWPHSHSLYPVFVTAAENWRAAEPLYTNAPPSAGGQDVFRYSPLVAALFTPLSLIAPALGGVLWRLLNAGIFLGGLTWFSRAVLPYPLNRHQRALLFLLVLPLAVGNFNNAQSNPLVLGLVLCTVAAAAEQRWNLAAGCMALACLIKIYPLAVGLLLVSLYPRRLTPPLLAVLALGLALPFLLQNPDYVVSQYTSWVDYLHSDDRSSLPLERCYRDLQFLGRVWTGSPLSPRVYQFIQVLAGAAMALLCLARRKAGWLQRRLLTLLLGLGCCWMTVFGPATESCTFLLLGPALAWALLEAWQDQRPLWTRAWLVGAYGLLVATYMSCWFPSGARLQSLGLQPLAGLMLLAHLVTSTLKPGQTRAACQGEIAPYSHTRAA
jgi:hypothetical protein